FTFPATANVVEIIGAKPIFVDISLETFNIDAAKIEANISGNTKAIIPVHEFGLAANLDAINEICKKHNLKIIEVAACALGTSYHNEFVGTKGDIGCFSLHPRKAITTGEGGIIATNNSEIASKLRILRNHGISAKDNVIDFVLAGFNYRMTDIQGALGNAQMEKLDSIINRRRELASLYFEGLSCNRNLLLPVRSKDNGHTYQTYYVILNRKLNRDSVMRELREQGIECNYGAYPLHSLSYYKQKYSYDTSEFMNSLIAYEQGIA
ncbi:MAG: DegT/DnrJ/EryC1/StrS family aminotransferase, partial [Clostridiaceae bacterium]|nr:DegT/DnrJ/EryC1/StrS family aminotransferase [Clostridiaceae bacterium]